MVAIQTVIKLAIVLLVLIIIIYLVYKYGFAYAVEEKERQDCLTEVRKICTDCQLIGVGPKECLNTLTGKYEKCRNLLDEKGEKITDCTKYIGKIE